MPTRMLKKIVEYNDKEITYEWECVSGKKLQATIHFRNGLFTECIFQTEKNHYSYDDWMFLKALAVEIEKLSQHQISKRG